MERHRDEKKKSPTSEMLTSKAECSRKGWMVTRFRLKPSDFKILNSDDSACKAKESCGIQNDTAKKRTSDFSEVLIMRPIARTPCW